MSKFYREDKDVLLVYNKWRVETSDSSKTFAQLLLLIAYYFVDMHCFVWFISSLRSL